MSLGSENIRPVAAIFDAKKARVSKNTAQVTGLLDNFAARMDKNVPSDELKDWIR